MLAFEIEVLLYNLEIRGYGGPEDVLGLMHC